MTQKELSYVEDAIGHESNIIKICTNMVSNLQDEALKSFMASEVEKHTETKNRLMHMLEVKAND